MTTTKNIVPVSGGKDSQAVAIWAKNNLDSFSMVFNDVKWEARETYLHLEYMEAMFGQKIEVASSNKYEGMADMATKKKRFPSTKARFCTEELKVKPMIDFILSHQQDLVIYIGVRAAESEARRNLKPDDEYFKFYFEPYKWVGKYDKQITILQKKLDKSKAGNSLSLGFSESIHSELSKLIGLNQSTLKPVYHTYRKEDVLSWLDKYSADVKRPILKWSADEVFNYIFSHGQIANPLYKKGFSRVGCYPCIMCSHQEILNIAEQDPDRIEEIAELEIQANTTFFPPGFIPERFCSKVVTDKKGKIKHVPTVKDVAAYVLKNPNQQNLGFRKEGCISPYSICETELAA